MEEIAQHIIDLVRNGVEAGATLIEVVVEEDPLEDYLRIVVRDNGHGLTAEEQKKVFDPFYTTKANKRVGLGLPLLRDSIQQCGGVLRFCSQPGRGTVVEAIFPYHHIDRAPLGDIASTISVLLAQDKDFDLVFKHVCRQGGLVFDTREFRLLLEGVPLNTPAVLTWVKQYLQSSIMSICGINEGGDECENYVARRAG